MDVQSDGTECVTVRDFVLISGASNVTQHCETFSDDTH